MCVFSSFFLISKFPPCSRFMQINCFAPEAPLGAYISALVFILLLFLAWVSLFLHKFQPSSCSLNLLLSGASSVYAQMKTSAEKDVCSSIWRLCHSALDKCTNPAASAEASPLGTNSYPSIVKLVILKCKYSADKRWKATVWMTILTSISNFFQHSE